VIPNFVDSDMFFPAPYEDPEVIENRDVVVTHISNFRPVKRIEDLVSALSIVTKKAPDVRLVLVGNGPERHKIERLVDDLDLRKNVQFTGYRSDIPHLLGGSDVVVLCSETESAPLTLLEGMSCGLPVIATEIGGIPEIVDDGVNGYLVPLKQPEIIAERILELNADLGLRKRLGEAARETVLERYTIDKIVMQYTEFFEEIISA
jgi:N-acetyl-alpha-D-glucosaminyl L-malate synthase BshA